MAALSAAEPLPSASSTWQGTHGDVEETADRHAAGEAGGGRRGGVRVGGAVHAATGDAASATAGVAAPNGDAGEKIVSTSATR